MAEELEELTTGDESTTETEETREQLLEQVAQLREEKKNVLDGNSRSGRENKQFREEMTQNYSAMMDKINELSTAKHTQVEEEDGDDDYDSTEIKKVRKIAREEARRDREEADVSRNSLKTKYLADYEKATYDLGDGEDPETYKSILTEMEQLGGYSDSGSADAKYNYQLAERNYYKRMFKSPEGKATAFKEVAPSGGIGGSSTVANKESTDAEYAAALKDPHVQEYKNRRGKSDEWVRNAIEKNKTPLSGTVTL